MTTDLGAGCVARGMLAIALLLGSAPLAAQSRVRHCQCNGIDAQEPNIS
jgi:hypothetical protein